ncbi:MAG TPA: RIP metalloprotease RseP [Rhizomicrobium sp.]|nr:RIP metalloprotease RseP [Rhizomicrobium sp.]
MTALHDFLAWLPSGAPAYIFLITVVVFFHELGHFLVARWCGVAVETFSIGFGPEIVGWNDRRGTRWKISWIPFGGYVKFLGDIGAASTPDRELLESLPEDERAGAFPLKPLWQRAAIVAAGPFANFILAIVIFTAMFMIFGQSYNKPIVDGVVPGSPAALAGIQKGDLVRSINGSPINDFSEIKQIVTLNTGEALAIGLERNGHALTVMAKPKMTTLNDPFGGKNRMMGLGITNIVKPDRITRVHFGPIQAVDAASEQTWLIVKSTFVYMWQMSTGYADTSQLRGPIGVASVSQKVASISFVALITLAALMSVSIGLINLFPIPLLDGGHLLYYGFEAVLGRPLGVRAQDVGFRLGLAAVLGLMVLVTWNDLVRLDLF